MCCQPQKGEREERSSADKKMRLDAEGWDGLVGDIRTGSIPKKETDAILSFFYATLRESTSLVIFLPLLKNCSSMCCRVA